jgi:osmotically-inducible protein OsmY
MKYLSLFITATLMLLLQGCVAAIVGGTAGGVAYLNRQRLTTYYQDSNIQYHIRQRINHEASLKQGTHIDIAVYHRIVLLAGEVLHASQLIKAGEIAKAVPDIKRVYNELKISGSTSLLTRTSDSLITSRVKSHMLAAWQLESRNIKIVTDNGIVYLMGEVTQPQAQLAEKIARQVSGVRRVVTLFEIKKVTQAQ